MPRYDFHCISCSIQEEHYLPYAEFEHIRETGIPCPCGGIQMLHPNYRAVFSPRPVFPFFSPAAGREFTSEAEYARYRSDHNLEYAGSGWI